MTNILLIITIICAVGALIVSLRSLRQHQRLADTMRSQQQAWERAQEVHQQRWKSQQERHDSDFEKYFAVKVQQLQADWQKWQQETIAYTNRLQQDFNALTTQTKLEYEIAHIPRIEDVPIQNGSGPTGVSEVEQPQVHLAGADLSGRELSSRYFAHADLRGTQFVKTKLFMSDLSWSSLIGADLSEADLSGTNLTHADLRGANLSRANFLVADMHNAILIGANLLGAHNLTAEQLHSAIYDGSTLVDEELLLASPFAQPVQKAIPLTPLSLTTITEETPAVSNSHSEPAEFVTSSIVEEPSMDTADAKADVQAHTETSIPETPHPEVSSQEPQEQSATAENSPANIEELTEDHSQDVHAR